MIQTVATSEGIGDKLIRQTPPCPMKAVTVTVLPGFQGFVSAERVDPVTVRIPQGFQPILCQISPSGTLLGGEAGSVRSIPEIKTKETTVGSNENDYQP